MHRSHGTGSRQLDAEGSESEQAQAEPPLSEQQLGIGGTGGSHQSQGEEQHQEEKREAGPESQRKAASLTAALRLAVRAKRVSDPRRQPPNTAE